MTKLHYKTVAMQMRVPSEFRAQVAAHAELDGRSMTGLIVAVMTKWIDGKPYEPISRPAKPEPPAKPVAAPKEFVKTFGRQRAANEANREPWLFDAISEAIARVDPAPLLLTTDEVCGYALGKPLAEQVPNFDRAIENQLLLLGWTQWVQRIEGSPDHLVWRMNA